MDQEVMDIVNIAKELGGEGFTDMIEDDIRERIGDCEKLSTDKELEEMMQSPKGCDDDDDVMEDTGASGLMDMIAEYDPSMEHGIMVIRRIMAPLKLLQDLFDQAKKRKRQLVPYKKVFK
ncbi:hypothetical protein TTRE_0000745201 [Trichuris trichiura]|uniref:Uncharacterized protein n=1 Tax=Trichuris trichiura TaxID=36087 RepID=A0A077ZFE2_TRITR|nr:hypothetical protein TTRE_0000745201 [Trichuris trichiura]